eukprot:CAMPEP_0171199216 /NCGR_PEP_ID=MMETSP0790-20130122/23350_1 /TAXON_ID=2925 /ORGANISM="Alexandrium catenella, Strain OF101" /LENGTH=402 /DNA_ID=CAMNT_0011664557 /DNA_START=85 /DNA_END=1293 /DNA_ORIENTATION=-
MIDQPSADLHGLSLGPTVDVFFPLCLKEKPVRFVFAWSTAAIALAAILCIACAHAARLRRAAICLQRAYYMRIVAFPAVMGFFSFFNLFCPRAWVLCHLVQTQYEAIAISTFGTILFMLLSIESLAFHRGRSGDAVNGEEPPKLPSNAVLITEALQAQGAKKHFGAPPFGCFLRPCIREHHLTAMHLLQVSWMVRQYAYASVILGAFMMWTALAMKIPQALRIYTLYTWVLKVSGLVAVYGLMILYLSTKKLLHHWRTTLKFICIKGIVLITILQERILTWLIEATHDDSTLCLAEPGYPSKSEHLVHFWNSYLVTLEALAFACLVARAFPAGEVGDFAGHHLDLVEVELEQFHRTAKRTGGKAASFEGEEGDDEGGGEEESESAEQPAAEGGSAEGSRATV